MVAIGVALFILGFIIVRAWGSPFPGVINAADSTGGTISVVGVLLVLIGLVAYGWNHFI